MASQTRNRILGEGSAAFVPQMSARRSEERTGRRRYRKLTCGTEDPRTATSVREPPVPVNPPKEAQLTTEITVPSDGTTEPTVPTDDPTEALAGFANDTTVSPAQQQVAAHASILATVLQETQARMRKRILQLRRKIRRERMQRKRRERARRRRISARKGRLNGWKREKVNL